MFKHLHVDGDRLYVTSSSNHTNLRVPNRHTLAFHAACARVAHMSGAANAFDEAGRDVEETRDFAFDGSSARLLDHLMIPYAPIHGLA
jgi:hypothetical protein